MVVTYDPEKQGRELSGEEIKYLQQLRTDVSSFSTDDPELTDALAERMKAAKNLDKKRRLYG